MNSGRHHPLRVHLALCYGLDRASSQFEWCYLASLALGKRSAEPCGNVKMGRLIFVHGTGVRRKSFDSSFAAIKRRFGAISDLQATPCYWGDGGADLPKNAKSIPDFDKPKEEEKELDNTSTLWGLLYSDPTYEFKILQMREQTKKAGKPGQEKPWKLLREKAIKFQPSDQLKNMLEDSDLIRVFIKARDNVVADPSFKAGLETAGDALGEYREAIARAFLAESIRLHAQQLECPGWLRADKRMRLVTQLVDELGGKELAFGGWLLNQMVRLSTPFIRNKRDPISSGVSPMIGDILKYQAKREMIMDPLRKLIHEHQAERPVVVLAHSLGGVGAVDLLIAEDLPVDLLITVGSQAPFFYEIGALSTLKLGEKLPSYFPKWINVYDPRDFLSYCADGVFYCDGQNGNRVADSIDEQRVDNGQPFPESHSAYWENPDVWEFVKKHLP